MKKRIFEILKDSDRRNWIVSVAACLLVLIPHIGLLLVFLLMLANLIFAWSECKQRTQRIIYGSIIILLAALLIAAIILHCK